MVGRETELAQLRGAFDRAVAHCSCELFTIVGEAGVGKSRLVRTDGLNPRAKRSPTSLRRAAAGRREEAVATFEKALDRYERKRNLAMVAQMQERLRGPRGEHVPAPDLS